MENCLQFKQTYITPRNDTNLRIIEIGSQNINGSIRELFTEYKNYLGVDFVSGNGVDHILADPYQINLESNSADVILTSSCLEHSEMFWLLYLEVIRVLKPNGLFYMNVPSAGFYHKYPIDAWRFFPDSAASLSKWANRNGYNTQVLESFIDNSGCLWKNFVGVTIKNVDHSHLYTARIAHTAQESRMTDLYVKG